SSPADRRNESRVVGSALAGATVASGTSTCSGTASAADVARSSAHRQAVHSSTAGIRASTISTATGLIWGERGAATSGGAPGAVPGVAMEVTERRHGPVTAGVAESTRGAHGSRSGIGGVGDRELGRAQDRLAGPVTQFGGRLCEPAVLPLVVLDDPG